jgi:hypothetical protein
MQTLMLWALLAKGGEGYVKDLKPSVEAADRRALMAAGLVSEEKRVKRAIWLEVTDKGWAWAADHLGDELSARSTAGTIVLRDWLARLQAFMRASNTPLAAIVSPRPAAKPETARPAPPETLRERIRGAYLKVTGGQFNKRALLSELRAGLADIDRATLDKALHELHGEEGTTLMTLDNPREITAAEKSAALSLAGEPMHLLWIAQ